ITDETYCLLKKEIEKRGVAASDKTAKDKQKSLLQEAFYRCFRHAVALYGFLLGKNAWLNGVKIFRSDSKEWKLHTGRLLKKNVNFTTAYSMLVEGAGSHIIYQQTPKNLYRECIKTMYDPDRIELIESEFLEYIKPDILRRFDDEYSSLIWQSNPAEASELIDLENVQIDSSQNNINIEIDDLKENPSAEAAFGLIYDLLKENPVVEEEDIILKNPEDFFIAHLFIPDTIRKVINSLYKLDSEAIPIEIRSLSLSKILSEPPGYLTLAGYSGAFADQTSYVFRKKDLNNLLRGNKFNEKEIILQLLKPGSSVLSRLISKKTSVKILRSGYVNFSNMNIAEDELALKITYNLQAGNWHPIRFHQYISLTFINNLLIHIIGEDRLVEIQANKRNLLLSVMDLNAGIKHIADNTAALKRAFPVQAIPDIDPGDELDSENENTTETDQEGFLFDLELLRDLPQTTIQEFIYIVQTIKNGPAYLKKALSGASPGLIKTVTRNMSANSADSLLADIELYNNMTKMRSREYADGQMQKAAENELKPQREYEILRSKIVLCENLYLLWSEKEIEISAQLKSIFEAREQGDMRTQEIEVESMLNSPILDECMQKLEPADIQQAVRLIQREELTAILSQANDSLKRAVLGAFSEQGKKLLQEDIDFWKESNTGEEDTEWKARKKTASSVKKLQNIAIELLGDEYLYKLARIWDNIIYYYNRNEYETVIAECMTAISFETIERKTIVPYQFFDAVAWTYAILNKKLLEAEKYHDQSRQRAKDNYARCMTTDTLGYIRFKQRKYKDALALFKKADSYYPGVKFVLKHIEEAEERLKKQKK
ncbi:hypothetical protein ACFL67_04385, partial [candidate division KSB1 bacterium]